MKKIRETAEDRLDDQKQHEDNLAFAPAKKEMISTFVKDFAWAIKSEKQHLNLIIEVALNYLSKQITPTTFTCQPHFFSTAPTESKTARNLYLVFKEIDKQKDLFTLSTLYTLVSSFAILDPSQKNNEYHPLLKMLLTSIQMGFLTGKLQNYTNIIAKTLEMYMVKDIINIVYEYAPFRRHNKDDVENVAADLNNLNLS